MNVQDVYDAIADGEVDGNFDQIYDAIKARSKVLSERRALELTTGTKVVLTNVNPKYLQGMRGVITQREARGKFTVLLDEKHWPKAGRYAIDGELHRCSAGMLELVGG